MNVSLAIIGAGPAGIAAAIQAKRLGLSFALIERNEIGGQAIAAGKIENLLGFTNGISGIELTKLFASQLMAWKIDVIKSEVDDISKEDGKFKLSGSALDIRADFIIMAIGLTPKLLNVPNELPYAPSHMIEHTGRKVLIVGSGDSAFDIACGYAKKAASVTICMRGGKPKANDRLVDAAISLRVRIVANGQIEKIEHDILISCIGKEAKHPILLKMKERFGKFEIVRGMASALPDLYFAGDICHPNERYISIAAGDGISACDDIWRKVHANYVQDR